jgi:hypothetical protein
MQRVEQFIISSSSVVVVHNQNHASLRAFQLEQSVTQILIIAGISSSSSSSSSMLDRVLDLRQDRLELIGKGSWKCRHDEDADN